MSFAKPGVNAFSGNTRQLRHNQDALPASSAQQVNIDVSQNETKPAYQAKTSHEKPEPFVAGSTWVDDDRHDSMDSNDGDPLDWHGYNQCWFFCILWIVVITMAVYTYIKIDDVMCQGYKPETANGKPDPCKDKKNSDNSYNVFHSWGVRLLAFILTFLSGWVLNKIPGQSTHQSIFQESEVTRHTNRKNKTYKCPVFALLQSTIDIIARWWILAFFYHFIRRWSRQTNLASYHLWSFISGVLCNSRLRRITYVARAKTSQLGRWA